MSYRQLRKDFGKVFRDLVLQKESEIIEGRLVVDHVLMLISILPKYAVTQVVGYIKGKSAIWVSKVQGTRTETEFGGKTTNLKPVSI